MKKTLITLSFIAILQTALAQTQAEKLFQQTMNEYQQSPLKNIIESLNDNYVFFSGGGVAANKSQLVATFKNVKSVEVSFKDLVVKQIGNTVIATGQEHSIRHFSDGKPDLTLDYLSTYIYEIKGNKLMGVSGQHTYPAQNAKVEETNVRKTIEAETNAYHAGDVEGMNKQWAYNASYVERMQEYLKKMGASAYMKGDALRAFGEQFKKVHKPTGLTYKISDYEPHVGTTNAWVTYTQESFDASGKMVNKSRELRILERLDGWKIVAMSNVEM